MTWGSYIQPGVTEELDALGAKLSVEINCAVHYPAYNKHLFECMCGVIFPVYLIRGGGWEAIRKKHEEERNMVKTNA